MRVFLAALAAVLCLATRAEAFCPPYNVHQRLRAIAEAASKPDLTPIAALDMAIEPFCQHWPQALICTGGTGVKPSAELVRATDKALRMQFEYVTDYVQYGVAELWRTNVTCGDCEDYALTLAERLHDQGVGGQYMRLMAWTPEPAIGHATLLVETVDAGVLEISVGDQGAPAPYDPTYGLRFASIRFDGRRKIVLEPGFSLARDGHTVVLAAARR